MNAKTFEAVQRHGNQLLAIFPQATEQNPIALCKKLRRIEAQAHKLAEDYCNGVVDAVEWLPAEEKILSRLSALLNPGTVDIFINGDPRGYALKIKDDYMREHNLDLYRDWGGYGILAPDFS